MGGRSGGRATGGLVVVLALFASSCSSGESSPDSAAIPTQRHAPAGRSGAASDGALGVGGVSDGRGRLVGTFVHTFYWMEFEADYPGAPDTPLAGRDCQPLATVSKAFADRVCVEGTGRLTSGALLNLSGPCACGYPCPDTGVSVCFFSAPEKSAHWGYGSNGNPLVPLRSLAIAGDVLPRGTVLYIPEWNGVKMPEADGIGGFEHDGCFRIDDIGYGIEGTHYDLYTGTSNLWQELEALRPTNSSSTLYRDPPRCVGKVL
jgi:3D (Asp-Asp-Asp) domain-containing protein